MPRLVGSILAEFDAEMKKLEQEAITETTRAARVVTQALFGRTPVHTGETVRNYVWKIGGFSGARFAALGGEPEQTSKLPLGPESNRGVNQAAALAGVAALRPSKLTNLFVTNNINSVKWDLIDSGSAPLTTKPRNPGGVSRIALQIARSRLKENFT